jgi:hypothetical protein
MSELAVYSQVDTDRFGKRIYRSYPRQVADVEALDRLAAEIGIDMVIARCPVDQGELVHALEGAGHRLMDTLVYYSGPSRAFEHAVWPHSIRRATLSDRDALQGIALDAFTNYQGHYHADPRLDPQLATLGYVDWCLSSIEKAGHAMWVAVEGNDVAGFIAVRLDASAAEITLNGVGRAFQRRGIYDSLVKAAGQAALREGIGRVQVSTQLSNLAPQKVWTRNGMCVDSAVYTFHKWF